MLRVRGLLSLRGLREVATICFWLVSWLRRKEVETESRRSDRSRSFERLAGEDTRYLHEFMDDSDLFLCRLALKVFLDEPDDELR